MTTVYEVPCVNPVNVNEPEPACVRVLVTLPGLKVAVYEVIVAPPSLTGAVKGTEILLGDSKVAVPIMGAPGTLLNIILLPPVAANPETEDILVIDFINHKKRQNLTRSKNLCYYELVNMLVSQFYLVCRLVLMHRST
jgi:hypothetical protein